MGKFLLTMSFLSLFSFVSCSFAKGGDKKEIKSSEIIKLINKGKNVQMYDKIIIDDLDFTQLKQLSFATSSRMEAKVGVNVFFCNCVFMGKVSTVGKYDGKMPVSTSFSDNLVFFDCDFRNDVTFDDCSVKGSLEFSRSVFRGETSFNNFSCVGQYSRFIEVTAEKGFTMCFASIFGNINFKDSKFSEKAYFQGLKVGGNLMFLNSSFANEADFSNSSFSGDVLFNYATFEENVMLSFSRFLGRCDVMHAKSKGNFSIENSIFFAGLKLVGSDFASVETRGAHSMLMVETEGIETHGKQLEIKSFNINNK